MNYTVFAGGRLRPTSLVRGALLAFALALPAAAHAQLTTVTSSYAVPHLIDGGAQSFFYDFGSFGLGPDSWLIETTLSLDFTKAPDLWDDPPFFSELAFTLRKLDTTFFPLAEVRLVDLGSFSDGAPGSSFSGELTFSDSAMETVNVNPDSITAGVFQPVAPLSLLNGLYSPFWELRLEDASFQNPLLFHSASLTLTVRTVSAVPEPSTFAMAAVFLFGMTTLLLRRRFVGYRSSTQPAATAQPAGAPTRFS